MNDNFYSSNNITAGGNIYATNGSVNCVTLAVSTNASVTGSITCNKVIAPVLESSVSTLSLKVNTNTEVLSLTDTGSFLITG